MGVAVRWGGGGGGDGGLAGVVEAVVFLTACSYI